MLILYFLKNKIITFKYKDLIVKFGDFFNILLKLLFVKDLSNLLDLSDLSDLSSYSGTLKKEIIITHKPIVLLLFF